MKNLFNKSSIQRHKEEKSVVRNITGEILENYSSATSEDLWTNDPLGTGLKNTQQLLVDWSKYEEHVFFNSAEGKVNLAFDQIINGFPFDGTSLEKETFRASIGGFTKHVLDQFATNRGYFFFNGDQATSSNNNVYLEVSDQTGKLAPDLAKVVGEAKASENFHVRGATHEFWIYVPSDVSGTDNRCVYQKKANDLNRGVSIYAAKNGNGSEFDITIHISSDDHKAIKHTIVGLDSGPPSRRVLPLDTWHHIAFVYERATNEKVLGYVNGVLESSTENNRAELDDIQMGDGTITMGKAIAHTSYADTAGPHTSKYFRGLIDEFRVWSTIRTKEQIYGNMHRNIDAQQYLNLYYRFNEPTATTPYQAKSIVLDYSGSALHTVVNNLTAALNLGHDPKGGKDGVSVPLKLESAADNPILFPDWPANSTLNTTMLKEANHYDRNNPNLITKLIPAHYFEEAQYFEGIEDAFETPKAMETRNIEYPLPGHAKLPTRVVMLGLLLTWANFFDDIKLYIDHFSLLGKVTYDTYNQIPPQVIMFLADYYGISLPNPYANENPAKFKKGEDLENASTISTPLSQTLDKMWRRILVNLPWLLRSRGTLMGIKGLMNTLGLEADSVFKFKEYGGAVSKQITSGRKKMTKSCGILDFQKIDYLESSPLWAWRHEPGGPDPAGAPAVGEILFQSGDIIIATSDGPPLPTTFTSGSWAWEGRYQLLKTETTSSLFRIENGNDLLVNLVAMRAENSAGPDFNLRLFIDGYKATQETVELDLPNVNLWDENPWYISINNTWGAQENSIEVRCIKTSGEYIVEHHSASINYKKHNGTGIPKQTVGSDTTYNTGAPLFEADDTATHSSPGSGAQYALKYSIGTTGKTYNDTWNHAGITGSDASTRRSQAETTSYSGLLSHMRFWTKELTRSEQIEHAHNPFSVSTANPVNSFAFPNQPIIELNSGGTAYETIPLGKYGPSRYYGTLPQGSWERLRNSFDMQQSNYTFSGSPLQLQLTDTTQNNDHITLYGVDTGIYKTGFTYTVVGSDFDSNSTSNKVRIRSFADKETAEDNFAFHGELNELPFETGVDDRRFSIESSLVHSLNDDMVNMLGDLNILNNFLGAPELEYAVSYPEIAKLQDLYFQRLVGKVNYNAIIEFQRWFNNNFSSLIEQFIPHTADFLGINFIVESHFLERHKMEYKQGDVHVDIRDRQAFSQEPLFLGTIRMEIT